MFPEKCRMPITIDYATLGFYLYTQTTLKAGETARVNM